MLTSWIPVVQGLPPTELSWRSDDARHALFIHTSHLRSHAHKQDDAKAPLNKGHEILTEFSLLRGHAVQMYSEMYL